MSKQFCTHGLAWQNWQWQRQGLGMLMAVAGLAGKKGEKPRSNAQGQPRNKMSSPKARPLPEEGPSRGRLLEQQSVSLVAPIANIPGTSSARVDRTSCVYRGNGVRGQCTGPRFAADLR